MIQIRKLVLNKNNFPSKFLQIEDLDTDNNEKQKFVEQQIIQRINNYNPKLNISEILYEDLSNQFDRIFVSNYTGAIIEDFEIAEEEQNTYKEKGFYIHCSNNGFWARQIIEYVYVSGTQEQSRNIFVSQIIFPTLIDYIGEYLDSPSYEPANHKFMFLNIVNKEITANSILSQLSLLMKTGMDYIDVFIDNKKLTNMPDNLESFFPDRDTCQNIYEDEYFKINFKTKYLVIKKEYLKNNIECRTDNTYDFKGSSEKFYWTPIYITTMFAYKLGYKIDYSEYTAFCNKYNGYFSSNSEKFNRCKILLKYFDKCFQ